MTSLTIDCNFRHPAKIKASLCGILTLGFPNDNTFVLSSGAQWVVQIWRRGFGVMYSIIDWLIARYYQVLSMKLLP